MKCARSVFCVVAAALLLTGPVMFSSIAPFSVARAQESETTRQLDADAARYRELLEAQRAEQARLEASLGELSGELEARFAERDQAGQDLLALRGERETVRGNVAALEAELFDKRAQVEALSTQQAALQTEGPGAPGQSLQGPGQPFCGGAFSYGVVSRSRGEKPLSFAPQRPGRGAP